MPDLDAITDALRAAQKRGALPTSLDTAGLRALGAEFLAKNFFTAKGTSALFTNEAKKYIDLAAGGSLSDGQVRTLIWEVLDALQYDAEKGGFPGEEVEPAVKGSLQDLKSFRRRDLIVRTQRDLMRGAGLQMRAMEPDSLSVFPAFELVRIGSVEDARDWPARWIISGFPPPPDKYSRSAHTRLGEATGMIGLIGDPRWGELGSYDNFADALGVDHAPFYFNSQVGQRLVSKARCIEDGVKGPNGESIEKWFASRPVTLAGKVPLPTPKISLKGVDPDLIARFKAATKATEDPGKPGVYSYAGGLADETAKRDAARAAREAAEKAAALASYPKGGGS